MALLIHADGLDSEGITLISPTRPEFDTLARPLLGHIADVGLKLKPMLVIVSNESAKTVVSFSKTWHLTYPNGRTGVFRGHTSFPEAVCGDVLIGHHPHPLSPGEKRVEAHDLVIQGWGDSDVYYDQFLPQFIEQKDRLLADASELRIELDAVIFDDGTLVGRDEEAWLSNLFGTHVTEKQRRYRAILEALDSGQRVEEAFEPLTSELAEVDLQMRTNPRQYVQDTSDTSVFWRLEAARDVARWRRRFSDEQIPALLRNAIRLEPFVIRRPGA